MPVLELLPICICISQFLTILSFWVLTSLLPLISEIPQSVTLYGVTSIWTPKTHERWISCEAASLLTLSHPWVICSPITYVQPTAIWARPHGYFPDDFQILPSSDITITVTSSWYFLRSPWGISSNSWKSIPVTNRKIHYQIWTQVAG